MAKKNGELFPALLKYWRNRRGISQLDLALAADVSSRHISFLETGRAQPSEKMILRIASTLDVPLRQQNELLRAVGYGNRFKEPELSHQLGAEISRTLDMILTKYHPYPIMVMNRSYDILRTNRATDSLMPHFIADMNQVVFPMNAFRLLFDPLLARSFVVDWPVVAQQLLSRLHRESLSSPEVTGLKTLLDELLDFPDVPDSWRYPDFETPTSATFTIGLRHKHIEVAFLTTVTTFSAPGNITLEDLRIESYFPLDDKTEQVCRDLAVKRSD